MHGFGLGVAAEPKSYSSRLVPSKNQRQQLILPIVMRGNASPEELQDDSPLDIYPLIISGPAQNRVDLTFFADGCEYYFSDHSTLVNFGIDTESEQTKFLEDAMRLAKDISGNQTFNTVKPLLNFWAAFSPSKEVNSISVYP